MSLYNPNRLDPLEKIGSIVWIVFWSVLAYIALTEQSITLGGRSGIHHYEGGWASGMGVLMIGAALIGVDWLARLNRWRRPLRLLLMAVWLGCVVAVVVTAL